MTSPSSVEIQTGANPTHAIIWLHGLGADGNDFAPLVPQLTLPGKHGIRFVFPHAPVRPVSINNGMPMRAWYDIMAVDLVRHEDAPGIRASEELVRALIANENARGIPTEKIVLAGFSQGCAMALHTGLRLDRKLAGIMGLSGYLPLADQLADQRNAANFDTPIFLAHGTIDPVVVPARAEATHQQLRQLGYNVSWHTYPMPHAVCPQEVMDIGQFLADVLR
jgi:phospholipase/carboxylesterase